MFGRKKRRSRPGSPETGDSTASGRSAAGIRPGAVDERIGRYAIEGPLGQGGMGVVYLAHDPVIGRKVAIKVITVRPETEDDARQYGERFLREAQAAGALVHPNIVAVHDIGQDAAIGRPYIVMEYVEGQDLKKVIKSRAPLPPDQAIRICLQIASGLDYAHSRGIVHRDIKPANVLLSERGQVKITDFGVARLPGSDLTQTDQMVGSPGFMSPEQLRGGAVDGRSDLFALGVILYQLVTGRSPFEGESVSEVLYRISTQPADPPSEAHPDVSPDFDPILEKALSKDPTARYQTGREMIQALQRLQSDGSSPAVAVTGPPSPAEAKVPRGASRGRQRAAVAPRSHGSRWRLGLLAAGLLLAFIGVNWAIHALFRGPLGKLAGESAAAARDGTAPAGGAPGLAVVGAPLPGVAARGSGLGGARRGGGRRSLHDTLAAGRSATSSRFEGLGLGQPAIDHPIVPVCAMTYAGPAEIGRVLVAYRQARAHPPTAADHPAGRIQLEFSHRLSSGRLIVLVDGRTVLSKPFDVPKGKKSGTLSHLLSIPAGKHGVEVRVLGASGRVEAKSRIAGIVGRSGTAILRAEERTGSRKPLRLEWEGSDKGV